MMIVKDSKTWTCCTNAASENNQSYQEITGNRWVGGDFFNKQPSCLGIHCKWH